jgi:hypothetical protein
MPDPKDLRTVWLRCTACGNEAAYGVNELTPWAIVRATTFRPQRCRSCGETAAEPWPRPYVITANDRRFLSGLFIAADDGAQQ